MLNSSNHHNNINPSQPENGNRDAEILMLQGDAIYDYERVPAGWMGFDDEPTVYRCGDVSAWQNDSDVDTE